MKTTMTPRAPFSPLRTVMLQRKCVCGGTPGPTGECEECRKKKLQRSTTHRDARAMVPPIVHDVLRSSGQPLDTSTRTFMESRFGFNFRDVRVHTDSPAAESAHAVNAQAYTVGHDIVFGEGQYAPQSAAGQELLAHELTHVVQQQGSRAALYRKEKKTKPAMSKTAASKASRAKTRKGAASFERPSCESSVYVFVDAPVTEPVSSSPDRPPVGPRTRAPLPGDVCGGANKDFLQHFSPNLRYQQLSNGDQYWWKDVRDDGGWMRELTIKKADETACTLTRQRTTPCPNTAGTSAGKETPSAKEAAGQTEPTTTNEITTVQPTMKCEAIETIDQFGQEYALFEDGTIRLEWGTDPHRVGLYVPDGEGRYRATIYDDDKLSLELSSIPLNAIGIPEEIREAAENCTLE